MWLATAGVHAAHCIWDNNSLSFVVDLVPVSVDLTMLRLLLQCWWLRLIQVILAENENGCCALNICPLWACENVFHLLWLYRIMAAAAGMLAVSILVRVRGTAPASEVTLVMDLNVGETPTMWVMWFCPLAYLWPCIRTSLFTGRCVVCLSQELFRRSENNFFHFMLVVSLC